MAFPNDLWISDPNEGKTFQIVEDSIKLSLNNKESGELVNLRGATAVLVSQDMTNVYVAHTDGNFISQITNGVLKRTIKVGNLPSGLAEDSKGNVYVSNYGDNTVTKLYPKSVLNPVVQVIPVDAGPRGLAVDSRDKLFVACYTGNVVDEIVNDALVNKIECMFGPRDLVCDHYDRIWVAVYGSNRVSMIKNSLKTLDIELPDGRGPCSIVAATNGSIYVANYLGNNVSVIKPDGSNIEFDQNIPVGLAPTSINITSDNTLYVTSEIDGTLTKIVDDEVIKTISVCTNPIGFGDATGCKTYNVNHEASAGAVSAPLGGWPMTSMSDEIQILLRSIQQNTVATNAALVEYNNATFPNVEAALDSLMQVQPMINKFTAAQTEYEVGNTVSYMQIEWAFNKAIATAEIKNGSSTIGELSVLTGESPVPMHGTRVIDGLSITNNSTISILTTDAFGQTNSASFDIKFYNRMLYGAVANAASVTPSQSMLDGLTKSPLMESVVGKYFTINCGATALNHPVIAFPSNWNIKLEQIMFTNGYSLDWTKTAGLAYTTATGATVNYDVYVFDYPLVDKVVIGIVKLMN